VERVVRDGALPDQIPQRLDRFVGVPATGRLVQGAEEGCAAALQMVDDRSLAIAKVLEHRRAAQPGKMVGQVESKAAVALAERLDAAPDHLARGRQRVEVRRAVTVHPASQDL
jgi:hypothetical protein